MITLDVLNALHNYTVLRLPLEGRLIRKCRYVTRRDFSFPLEIINHAIRIGRHDIVFNLGYAYLFSLLVFQTRRIKKKLMTTSKEIFKKLKNRSIFK